MNSDTDAPILVSMPLARIITFWQPGSHDWNWRDEYADIMRLPATAEIYKRVDSEGIDFLDHVAPVLLGNDGRVWDGHHRICIAIQRGYASLMVEMTGAPQSPVSGPVDPTKEDK